MFQCIFVHEVHTAGAGDGANAICASRIANGTADGLIEGEHFVDTDASFIASEVAVVATVGYEANARRDTNSSLEELRGVFRGHRDLFAAGAKSAEETLGDDTGHGGSDLKARDAEIEHASDGGDAVIGMESGKDQVAGLRGLESNLGSFLVADFTDHYDIGILAKNGTQTGSKRKACFGVDLYLIQARDRVLDGIFHRNNVDGGFTQQVEAGIQRGALT